MLDFNWRFADVSIGRFFVVDRLTEKFAHMTHYQFAFNNPVGKIELDGLEGVSAMNLVLKSVRWFATPKSVNGQLCKFAK